MNTKRVEEQVNLLVPNCTCKYIRETQQGTWKCDQWEFEINGEKFDFFTGLGHRGLTEKAKREIAEEYPPPRFLGTQAYGGLSGSTRRSEGTKTTTCSKPAIQPNYG